MNFPIELPFFRFLYLLINTPGLGGIMVGFVGLGSVTAYALVLKWVADGGKVDETETYAYPTTALHHE
jgi:hypothetical protein